VCLSTCLQAASHVCVCERDLMCMCVCVCVCVRERERECVCACLHADFLRNSDLEGVRAAVAVGIDGHSHVLDAGVRVVFCVLQCV